MALTTISGEIQAQPLNDNFSYLETQKQDKLFVSVTDSAFGAVGDGATDDTTAFNNAITYCIANKKKLIIPKTSSFYKISGTLDIDDVMDIGMDISAKIKFYPTASSSVLFYIHTYPNNFNFGGFEFGILESATAGSGIAIKADGGGGKKIYFNTILSFNTAILHSAANYNTLGNNIYGEVITQCTNGVHLLNDGANLLEGNRFDINFITEGKYGVILERNSTGSVALNQYLGNAIHMTQDDGMAIRIIGSQNPFDNDFDVQFLDSDGANGIIIGGTNTVNAETGFTIGTNYFKALLNTNTRLVKFNGYNRFINTRNMQSHIRTEVGYTPVTASGSAAFNSGVSVNNNYSLFSLAIPAGSISANFTFFAYHQLTGHATPKLINVIKVPDGSGVFPSEKFDILAFDNSASVNREVVIRSKYLATTTSTETVKIYLEIF